MHTDANLRIRTLMMVFFLVIGSNIGDLMLKSGMNDVGPIDVSLPGLRHAIPLVIANARIWIGIVFQILCTAGFMTMLSWADYSYAMPVGAFGYAMLTVFAVVFLQEHVSVQRWIGVFVICSGVFLVGRTNPRTTRADQGAAE